MLSCAFVSLCLFGLCDCFLMLLFDENIAVQLFELIKVTINLLDSY